MDSFKFICNKEPYDNRTMAQNMFSFCGAQDKVSLPANVLLQTMTHFMDPGESLCNQIKQILDPNDTNENITIADLTQALDEINPREDFYESFEHGALSRCDSGMGSDVSQQVIELQSELDKKRHQLVVMRHRMESTERSHDDSVASLTNQCEKLRVENRILKKENIGLQELRHDYEDLVELNKLNERRLDETQKQVGALKLRVKTETERADRSESEIKTLKDLISQSKSESHRMNEQYSNRQAALINKNEYLRTELAEVKNKYYEQESYLQQILQEQALLEMELKETQNKMNGKLMDRSLDGSISDASALRILDSLHSNDSADQSSEDISFLKDEKPKQQNTSLYEELRMIDAQSLIAEDIKAVLKSESTQTDSDIYGKHEILSNYVGRDVGVNTDNIQIEIKTLNEAMKYKYLANKLIQTDNNQRMQNDVNENIINIDLKTLCKRMALNQQSDNYSQTDYSITNDRRNIGINTDDTQIKFKIHDDSSLIYDTEQATNNLLQTEYIILDSAEAGSNAVQPMLNISKEEVDSIHAAGSEIALITNEELQEQTSGPLKLCWDVTNASTQTVAIPESIPIYRKMFGGLFTIFATICFIFATLALYKVTNLPSRSYSFCIDDRFGFDRNWNVRDFLALFDGLLSLRAVGPPPM